MSFFNLNFLKKQWIKLTLILITIFLIILFYNYVCYLYTININNYVTDNYSIKINYLGYSLFISGIIVGIFIFFLSDTKIFFKNILIILFFIFFLILIWFFINERSYINLFLIYELFLLPSFYLVYLISPNRRSIPVAIYFLTWTQFGSIFVLLGVIYIYLKTQSIYLIYNNYINYNILFLLFFIGFGIKVPMWPFYYWLTKTHVEASSFFSIYLSGFLVKTAIYLFNFFYSYYYNFYYINFLFIVVLIGIIDSSIKMWHQFDLKKLIAYTTVQEMNILFLPLFWNNELAELYVSFFIIIHCLLSSIFFFIIDILTKRFSTRVNTKITGLIHIMPVFTFFIFISIIFFCGLPFTGKFFIEIVIFKLCVNHNLEIVIFIFFISNWIAIIGFCKNFFNILFGSPILLESKYLDLNKREIFIFITMLSLLFLINYFTFIIF